MYFLVLQNIFWKYLATNVVGGGGEERRRTVDHTARTVQVLRLSGAYSSSRWSFEDSSASRHVTW